MGGRLGKKVPRDPIGYNCINVLVQRAIAKVRRKLNSSARGARWNANNRERISQTSKDLYQAKRDQRIEETTAYRQNNREHLMKTQCKREKERRDTDPEYHTAILLRRRLKGALKRGGNDKSGKTIDLVGCTVVEFNAHIELQGKFETKIELDHIFPFTCYNLDTDQHRVMHFTNYQPLTLSENRKKADKLPTKAMAAKVDRSCWPDGVTEDMLPDIYPGWSTPLRM
jgi:hypothetical protein